MRYTANKNNLMKVVILGSGNVASVLCALIQKGGHEIVQVASRNVDHAKELASKYNARAGSLNEPSFAQADIYILPWQMLPWNRLGKLQL